MNHIVIECIKLQKLETTLKYEIFCPIKIKKIVYYNVAQVSRQLMHIYTS